MFNIEKKEGRKEGGGGAIFYVPHPPSNSDFFLS